MSDDAAALIRAALPKPRERRQARYDMWGNELPEGVDPSRLPPGTEGSGQRRRGSGGERGDDSAGVYYPRETPPVWGRLSATEFLSFFAMPSQHLEIQQGPEHVKIGVPGRARTFVSGEEDPINLTDRFGSRSMRGGWVGDAFSVATSDGHNLTVDDSVRRVGDGRLARTIVVRATGAKSITVHAQYRRATASEAVQSVEEGPPAPIR